MRFYAVFVSTIPLFKATPEVGLQNLAHISHVSHTTLKRLVGVCSW